MEPKMGKSKKIIRSRIFTLKLFNLRQQTDCAFIISVKESVNALTVKDFCAIFLKKNIAEGRSNTAASEECKKNGRKKIIPTHFL
jgi:hypothetical protein